MVINRSNKSINNQDMVMNRLKVVLAEQRRTCKWLAAEFGKSENTVSRWTTNRIQPSVQQLYDIAAVLDVDVRCLQNLSKD